MSDFPQYFLTDLSFASQGHWRGLFTTDKNITCYQYFLMIRMDHLILRRTECKTFPFKYGIDLGKELQDKLHPIEGTW